MATLADQQVDADKREEQSPLLRYALAFDEIADALGFAFDARAGTADVVAGVQGLASREPEVRDNLERLDAFEKSRFINDQEYRFNLARIAAVYCLKSLDLKNASQPVRTAVEKFNQAGSLGTSGVDVLAAAILMPVGEFVPSCHNANHNIRILAGQLKLPKGAVALRQEVYHAAKRGAAGDTAYEPSENV